jgi:hypothetical protein
VTALDLAVALARDTWTAAAPVEPVEPVSREATAGRYDAGARRRAKRTGRETGCWTYIPGEELAKAGIEPGGKLPYYRVWGSQRGGIRMRLYREA